MSPVCRTCGDSYSDAGAGWDGECGSCADWQARRDDQDAVRLICQFGADFARMLIDELADVYDEHPNESFLGREIGAHLHATAEGYPSAIQAKLERSQQDSS